MKYNIISILLIIVFILPLIVGFYYKYSSIFIKKEIEDLIKIIAFVGALYFSLLFTKYIFFHGDNFLYTYLYNNVPSYIWDWIKNNPFNVYIISVPVFIIILYILFSCIFGFITSITVFSILDKVDEKIKYKSNIVKGILGILFNIPKSMVYVIIVTFMLYFLNIMFVDNFIAKYSNESSIYTYISDKLVIPSVNSELARKFPEIIGDSIKIVIKDEEREIVVSADSVYDKENVIVYYNGVRIEEGVESNEEIDSFARKISSDYEKARDKGKAIYDWISENIEYDTEKAKKIIDSNFKIKSGAINTFDTKSGVCFDYSCLFTAMSKAAGLKVRILTGEGFNGETWVNHSWNELYLEEEERWINVDTTFSVGGNYYDNNTFNLDHRHSKIVGEW